MRPELLLVTQQHWREQRPSVDERSSHQRMRAAAGEEVWRFFQKEPGAIAELLVPLRIALADDAAPEEGEISEGPEIVIIVNGDLRIVAVPAVVAGNEQRIQRRQVCQHPCFIAFELGP